MNLIGLINYLFVYFLIGTVLKGEECSELILIGAPFVSFLFWCMSIFRLVSLVVLPHVLVKPVFDYTSSYYMFIVSEFLSENDLAM